MARKSMSSLDVMAWVAQQASQLRGQRLDNIYQDGDLLAIRMRLRYGDFLVAQPGVRLHASARYQPGRELGPLAKAMRDAVRDLRVSEVKQVGFDRLVEITLEDGHRLVFELLPRGVIALVSPDGRLVAASSYFDAKDRRVRRGLQYSYPPLRLESPFALDGAGLASRLRGSQAKDIVRALVMNLGVPGEAAEEAAFRAGLKGNEQPQAVSEADLAKVADALRSIAEESLRGQGYVYVGQDGSPVQATPFRATSAAGLRELSFSTFDEALDLYFSSFTPRRQSPLDAERQRLLKSLEAAKAEAEEYLRQASALEAQANAVASSYYQALEALQCVKEGREGCGAKEVNRRQGYMIVNLSGVDVKLYLYETVDDAIKRLYRQAGELRAKAERASRTQLDIEAKLKQLEEQLELQELREKVSHRRRAWYERYHWLVTSSGVLAVGGRDADQNESLVRKMLGPNDVFLHADIHGAPAVILMAAAAGGFTETDVSEAAVLTAAYSRAWKEGMASVSVYWAYGSQVSKSPPSGEYLTKGSFMVYGKKNYLRPLRLELYLGIALDEEGLPVVVVGPESVVLPQSIAYLRVTPGDMKVEEAAEEIISSLSRAAPEAKVIRALDPSEVATRLPGRASISQARRGQAGGLRRPRGVAD
ncbi:Predicted fibronectin-binding protein [Acidilobus saccharovorans 345-15]|uniref:Predicted fibronectin-binding protein n=1 Tax=Acidilobus saccharovorans (strain DSM 16705 / JCM 18335 / VKM B-2471 / 345-15) TaxID=666510 RepID=D9PZU1_ACIS3|nr:ribosome rescue protein RqcH [Acidilobus saccharovorans]ADL18579.1 Predicted fibronectin-binding protein [Acidilobus saccharovorans 345-15]